MSRASVAALACVGACLTALLACGAAKTGVREPVVARIATIADGCAPTVSLAEAGPAPKVGGQRFELFLTGEVCARLDGKLHCKADVPLDSPLSQEPALLGGAADRDVRGVAIGRDFACAVMDGGDVRCFGANTRGQLGAGLRDERHDLPVRLPGVQGATAVFAGPMTACAILPDARVACWGKNDAGENGSSTNYLSPARELVVPEIVRGVQDVTSVAMGWDTTCAVLQNLEVHCWGRSRTEEQTAQRGETNEQPTRIDSMTGTTFLSANESTFCGVKDGEVACFGDTSMIVPEPEGAFGRRSNVAKPGVRHARKVSMGSSHACALTVDGSVYCFGIDADGVLGVPGKGGYTPQPPVKVADLPRAVDVACGPSMSCAITESDEAYCWGRFSWKTSDDVNDRPVKVRIVD